MQKVKDFLSSPESESGAYKASVLNIWFMLIIFIFVIMSVTIIMSLNGTIDMSGVSAAA